MWERLRVFFSKDFQDSGWQGIGLEPNSSMVSYGCDNLGLEMEVRKP